MRIGRAKGEPAPDTARPPHLVARFAVLTALVLGAGAATILLVTRHLDVEQAERHAAHDAQVYATGVLAHELRPADVRDGIVRARRAALDRLLRARMARDGVLRVAVTRPDGVIAYSTAPQETGARVQELDRVREALGGTITSRTGSLAGPQPGDDAKVLRSFVPVQLGGMRAVARIDQDYAPIAAAAREALLPVAGILEGVLVVLYLLLLPALIRASRRIQRQMERIHRQATTDELSGLPNRRLFLERLDASLVDAPWGSPTAVLALAVDRLAQVNDTLGHETGDRLLAELSRRLAALAPATALLARTGDDGLALAVPGAAEQDAVSLAVRLRSGLAEPIVVAEIPLAADLSVGIAVHPRDGADAAALLRHADVALRRAKDSRTSIRVYEDGQDAVDRTQLALLPELQRAIAQRELLLHYQLKADLGSGTVNGAEALVRWQHPDLGLLLPAAFLPYAETTGLGRELSRYVLESVIGDVAMLCQLGLRIPIALNLSALDLLDPTLPHDVAALLEREHIDPQLLELEITETAAMTDHELARAVIGELGALGTRLAVDDFGTGYSSLGYLTSLPIDTIKIDMSFVRGMLENKRDAAIVKSVIDLGHSLGLDVVAEGVETRELWHALQLLGCDTAQGFYFAEPRPLDDLLARLLSTEAVAPPRRGNVLKASFDGSEVDAVPAA